MTPIAWTELSDTLALGDRACVAFVGGGGKTTGVFALGRHRPGRRIVTTTTKMGSDRTGGRPLLLAPSDAELDAALTAHGEVLVWEAIRDHRADGVPAATVDRWAGLAETIAIEADGSRRRPFKAPAGHEPVVPTSATTVVACVGIDAIGAPIDVGCHRPELVAAIAATVPDAPLTVEGLAAVLLAETGSRKAVPTGADYRVLINRVRPEHNELVDELADRLGGVPLVAVADAPPEELPEPQ